MKSKGVSLSPKSKKQPTKHADSVSCKRRKTDDSSPVIEFAPTPKTLILLEKESKRTGEDYAQVVVRVLEQFFHPVTPSAGAPPEQEKRAEHQADHADSGTKKRKIPSALEVEEMRKKYGERHVLNSLVSHLLDLKAEMDSYLEGRKSK